MKPRIYLYDINNFSAKLLNDLSSLFDYYQQLSTGVFYIHIGFKAPSADKIASCLDGIPSGLYCSRGFKDGANEINWEFSGEIESKTHLGLYLVQDCGSKQYQVSQVTLEKIEDLVADYKNSKNTDIGLIGHREVPKVQDELLSNYKFSVRTTNVFKKENIVYISDLVKQSEASLLRLPNFGRKSLREVNEFLKQKNLQFVTNHELPELIFSEPIDEPTFNPDDYIGSSIYEDLINEVNSSDLSEREKLIVLKRSGLADKLTLQQLSEVYSITRERIRQIEFRSINVLFNKQRSAIYAWFCKISDLVYKNGNWVDFDTLVRDQIALKPIENNLHVLSFIITWTNKLSDDHAPIEKLRLTEYQNKTFLTHLEAAELEAIETKIVDSMQSSQRCALANLKSSVQQFITNSQSTAFEYIWNKNLKDCFIDFDTAEPEFIKYIKRSRTELAFLKLYEVIKVSDSPLSRSELEKLHSKNGTGISFSSVANLLLKNDEIFPMRHGLWGTFKHINFNDSDKNIIISTANTLLEKSPANQIHGRDIHREVAHKITDGLNEFGIAAILNKYSNLLYLGRCVFAKNDGNTRTRLFVHETLIKVLRVNDRPMHLSELREEIVKYAGVGRDIQQIVCKPPIINLGRNTYALDYWDDETLGEYVSSDFASLTLNQKNILADLRDYSDHNNTIAVEEAIQLAGRQYSSNSRGDWHRKDYAKTALQALEETSFITRSENIYNVF